MIAEVLIYVPSIANFRIKWLNDRLAAAHTAALVLDAAPSGMVPESLAQQILDSIGAQAVAMKMGNQRRLLAASDMPPRSTQTSTCATSSWWRAIMRCVPDAVHLQERRPDARGRPGAARRRVHRDRDRGRAAARGDVAFSRNILLLSLVISVITATLVYLSLHYLFVRPMHRITANMIAFRDDPENPARIIAPSGRSDEIGIAERELAAMQRDLASMLQQKSHLAALGLAVSKINHDLRNLLASAQLFSDRLATLPDPNVQRFAPKLMRALERAIAFCQSTLSYGRAQEPPPDRRPVALEALVEEVRETLGLDSTCRSAGSSRSSAGCRSMPTTTSCSASCSIWRAMRCRRWKPRAERTRAAIRCASPAGARAPWR